MKKCALRMTEIFLKFLVYLESEALFKELVCITKRLIKETMHFLARTATCSFCLFLLKFLGDFGVRFLTCSKFSSLKSSNLLESINIFNRYIPPKLYFAVNHCLRAIFHPVKTIVFCPHLNFNLFSRSVAASLRMVIKIASLTQRFFFLKQQASS